MATEHTPGPWVVSDASPDPGEPQEIGISAASNGYTVAVAIPGSDGPVDPARPTTLANAQVIAAAPELLDALKPFAAACNISSASDASDIDDTLAAKRITWGDLRRARAVLSRIAQE